MEITLLLKATQSSTESSMSTLEYIVKGKFENRYKNINGRYNYLQDIVQAKLMLKKNIDLTVYDPVKARAQFLGLMKHKPSFMPTKPKLKRSLTIDRLLSNRPKKKRKVEYKN